MNAQVTLRLGEEQLTITTSHPPKVGSTVMYKERLWLVTSCEYLLSRKITPFELIIEGGMK